MFGNIVRHVFRTPLERGPVPSPARRDGKQSLARAQAHLGTGIEALAAAIRADTPLIGAAAGETPLHALRGISGTVAHIPDGDRAGRGTKLHGNRRGAPELSGPFG